jgi:saccharopine dehydrogenase-like NADP-dependent oxidoreductase
MKKILVLGAGLSSSYLIKYLVTNAVKEGWHITVADNDVQVAESKTLGLANTKAIALNANDKETVSHIIDEHDVVISLLPAFMHVAIAKLCVANAKHLITASYVSNEMASLHDEALKAGILLLNECGLDPGIDHLSAMKMIDEVKEQGGKIEVFKSYCGGLVAPEYDDNPWNYKFTWNPRNVVVAGQATAKYLENNGLKFIPPSRIFTQTESVHIKGYGDFESYANRDSLGYIEPYGIETAHTVLRGTLRKKGYGLAWNCLVKLGLTDDSFVIHHADKLTYRAWLSAFVPGEGIDDVEARVCAFLQINVGDELFNKLNWLGLFSNEYIPLKEGTPAVILEKLLQQKWKLNEGELDMVVMYHELEYSVNNDTKTIRSALVVKGETKVLTAMAKTVGLPMAIACKLLLTDNIKARGVQIPITKEFYTPILNELHEYGISFSEEVL